MFEACIQFHESPSNFNPYAGYAKISHAKPLGKLCSQTPCQSQEGQHHAKHREVMPRRVTCRKWVRIVAPPESRMREVAGHLTLHALRKMSGPSTSERPHWAGKTVAKILGNTFFLNTILERASAERKLACQDGTAERTCVFVTRGSQRKAIHPNPAHKQGARGSISARVEDFT